MDDFNETQNIYRNLSTTPSNEQRFRLTKINEIEYYFLDEMRERELISKNLSKYIAALEYFDESLDVLSILSGSISIASEFVKRFLKTIRNKKKRVVLLMIIIIIILIIMIIIRLNKIYN